MNIQNVDRVKIAFASMPDVPYSLDENTEKLTFQLKQDLESEIVRALENHAKRARGIGFNRQQALGALLGVTNFLPMIMYLCSLDALDQQNKINRLENELGFKDGMSFDEKIKRAKEFREGRVN